MGLAGSRKALSSRGIRTCKVHFGSIFSDRVVRNGFAISESFTTGYRIILVNCPNNIRHPGFRCALLVALAIGLASSLAKAQFLTQDHSVDQNEIRVGMV